MWPILESMTAWAIGRPAVSAVQTSTSPLVAVPTEILLLIRDELDTVSTACLSLTRKSLHAIIDPRHTLHELNLQSTVRGEAMYPSHDQRRDFLQLCVRDHPNLYLCSRWLKLHKHKKVGPPGPLYHGVSDPRCLRQIGHMVMSLPRESSGQHDLPTFYLRAGFCTCAARTG